MSFKSFSDFGGVGRGGERRDEYSLVFSTSQGISPAVCFHMYPKLAKQFRVIGGDGIEILFDAEDRTCLIRRVKEGGITLSSSKGGKTLCARKSWHQGMPSVPKATAMEKVIVNEEGILAVFPSNTSFNGLCTPEYKPRIRKSGK